MAAVVLAGVEIRTGLIWQDRRGYSSVAQAVKRTLGGKMIVHAGPTYRGQPITLVSPEDSGIVTHSQVEALQALSESYDTVYPLQIGADSFNVVFRHYEPPAFSAVPIIPRTVQLPGDYYLVEIRLLTV